MDTNKQTGPELCLGIKAALFFSSFPSPLHLPQCHWQRQVSLLAARALRATCRLRHPRAAMAGSIVAAALLLPVGLRLPHDRDSAREAQVNNPRAPVLAAARAVASASSLSAGCSRDRRTSPDRALGRGTPAQPGDPLLFPGM